MVFRLQLICLQVQQPIRNLSIKLESSPLNESRILRLGEMVLDSSTSEDLNSGFKGKNMYILSWDPICGIPYKEPCSGPPSVPPQIFDMIPRPQGIVIREPNQDDDYLEQHSPDSVLFKDPSTVLQELTGTSLSQDEIMEEQCAIEADLLSQKLNDPSHTLALASQTVPDSCKRGPAISTVRSQEIVPSVEPSPQIMDMSIGNIQDENPPDQSTKPRSRKR
ncbi:hypothetical protein LINGRAHAP2_LOCUS14066 [Linum grandiflorum]